MSSARRTYSDRSLLLIASLYRSTAFFIFATSLFQVNGAAEPSSKKDRGNVAACGGPSEVLVNEVVEGPMIGMEVTIDRFAAKGSARERLMGDIPLMESIDVAGDTPSETSDRRFRGCRVRAGKQAGCMTTYI